MPIISVFGRFTELNWWFVKEKGASAPFSFLPD
jgi:hypothetical protein